MHKYLLIVAALGLTFFLNPLCAEITPQAMTAAQIIQKNVEAVGGEEALEAVKNMVIEIQNPYYQQIVSFYYITSDGKGKIVYTNDDLVWMVATINGGDFKVNSALPPENITPLDKVRARCFTKLFGGVFSLKNFKDNLKAEGIKKYGPEKHYVLSTSMDDHGIKFHIDTQDFLLKRLLITGGDAESGKYQASYEFGPFNENNGLNVPNAFFSSTIGVPGGGNVRQEFRNMKTNIDIPPDFFHKRELSFGKVSWKDPVLFGNGISSTPRGPYYVIITNWSVKDMEKAGLQSMDKIKVKIDATEIDALYIANNTEITGEIAAPGNAILLRNDQYFAVVVMWGETFKPIHDSFKKLCAISVTKTNK